MERTIDRDYLYTGATKVSVLKFIQKNREDYDGSLEDDLNEFLSYLTHDKNTFDSFDYIINTMGADIMYQPDFKKSALVSIVGTDGKHAIKYFEAIKNIMVSQQYKVIEHLGEILGISQSRWVFSDIFAEWLYEQEELNEIYKYIYNSTADERFIPQEARDIFIF